MAESVDPRETPLHPRFAKSLIGQDRAEIRLLAAFQSGKLHHAWLLAGLRGIGKATLAYRFAKFLLNAKERRLAPATLDVEPNSVAAQLVEARSHPDLLVIERSMDAEGKRLKAQIAVDDARAATQFLSLTAGMGGYRVCIVDAADDLNPNSANALLKILEEPPQKAVFLLVSHGPARLLPTIRSRCLVLQLSPLADHQVVEVMRGRGIAQGTGERDLAAIATLAEGSPGRACELAGSAGAQRFLEFQALASSGSFQDRRRLTAIAGALQKREAGDDFHAFTGLLGDWMAANARAAAGQNVGAANAWAIAHRDIGHSIQRANALNLDRRQLLLEAFQAIEEASRHRRVLEGSAD